MFISTFVPCKLVNHKLLFLHVIGENNISTKHDERRGMRRLCQALQQKNKFHVGSKSVTTELMSEGFQEKCPL